MGERKRRRERERETVDDQEASNGKISNNKINMIQVTDNPIPKLSFIWRHFCVSHNPSILNIFRNNSQRSF